MNEMLKKHTQVHIFKVVLIVTRTDLIYCFFSFLFLLRSIYMKKPNK